MCIAFFALYLVVQVFQHVLISLLLLMLVKHLFVILIVHLIVIHHMVINSAVCILLVVDAT